MPMKRKKRFTQEEDKFELGRELWGENWFKNDD